MYKKIIEGKFSIPSFVSDYAKDFIKCILVKDPAKRYTLNQIKSHPWFSLVTPKINEGLLIGIDSIPVITFI